jgi:hypothetical protein
MEAPTGKEGKNKSSTRGAQEEHKRVIRYLLACGSHEGGYVVALGWQAKAANRLLARARLQ